MIRKLGIPLLLITVAVTAAVWLSTVSAAEKDAMDPSIYTLDDIKWTDGPASLPKGAKVAVLEGDPAKEGPFVMRIMLPAGYLIPPHTHPKPERVTVISGKFMLGMGERFDEAKGMVMPAGAYGTWAPGMKHFAWVDEATTVQLHGSGPWMIEYLNPADDPRKAKSDG